MASPQKVSKLDDEKMDYRSTSKATNFSVYCWGSHSEGQLGGSLRLVLICTCKSGKTKQKI